MYDKLKFKFELPLFFLLFFFYKYIQSTLGINNTSIVHAKFNVKFEI
jgi:hypothetical protein